LVGLGPTVWSNGPQAKFQTNGGVDLY
jgi:hypothetical protein